MNKLEILEKRVKDLEDAFLKLKKDINDNLYNLDESNLSEGLLRKINAQNVSNSTSEMEG